MRAMQLDNYGEPDALHLVELPMPEVKPGSIRLRIRAAAVNPADYKWRSGMLQAFMPLNFPHVLGYDVAGTVDEIGPGVTGIQKGARVVAMLSHIDKGGYAEYAVIPAEHAVPIPDHLDFATAAALPTGGLTGVQLIEEFIQPEPGQTVLITGATGACGRFAMFATQKLGARAIAAVRATQCAEARALGAAGVIILGEHEWTGTPFDHVADTVGGPAVAQLCRHVAPGGRIGTIATLPIDPAGLPSAPVFFAVHYDPARLAKLAQTVAAGDLPVPIAQRLPLAEAAEAHRLVEAGGTNGKVILEP
jgi:NADPH:quinone reductase-like Zn-dependent oxidoreductase